MQSKKPEVPDLTKMLKINPKAFTVDHKAIAAGLYEMFDDGDRTLIAFGMLSVKFNESIEKHVRRRFGEIAADQLASPELAEGLADAVSKECIAEHSRLIFVELLGEAKKAGRLVV